MNALSNYKEQIYAIMRIITGLLFAFHGMQKILGILTDWQPEFLSQFWIGGMIELIAGLLIMVGFQTRWAAFLSSGTMAVAYIQFHWKFQFGSNFFPGINEGELAVIYSFLFLYIASNGAGIWAIDKK